MTIFPLGKIRTFTKSRTFGNYFITVLFILTFLLILFNKIDYMIVKKIEYLSVDVINPITKIITTPIVRGP